MSEKKRFIHRGVVTLGYTLLILAFLPLFPILLKAVNRHFPSFFLIFNYIFIPLLGILFVIYLAKTKGLRDPLLAVWTAVFLLSYGPLVYFYCEYPAERFHLVEYGFMVFLTYWWLNTRLKTVRVYIPVIVYAFSVGFLDEIVQGILPNRVYEFKDVTINWASSFLAFGLLVGLTWQNDSRAAAIGKLRKYAWAVVSLLCLGNGTLIYQKYVRPPLNVILITVDTLRPDHLSCYGYERQTTPFLDRIAQKGVIFKNVVSSAPWTSPGMISIFTGLYPSMHGVQARGHRLPPGIPTIFKVFKDHGYMAPDISYLTEIPNFSNLGLDPKRPEDVEDTSQPGDELFRWLDTYHRKRFILWYHYRFLHLPYNPHPADRQFLTGGMKHHLASPAVQKVLSEAVIPYGSTTFTEEEKATVIALYDSQLPEMDRFMKRLYDRMTLWKLHRNTLLVITADHGEELFEHGFLGHASTAVHATMYDEVLKIPLFFYAPSRLKGGQIRTRQVRQVDIMSTILDLVGLPIPDGVNGVSLMPRMNADGDGKPLTAISESVAGGYQSSQEQQDIFFRAIRKEDWKLECKEEKDHRQCRLYNLSGDPGETTDVAEKETSDALKEELFAAVANMQAESLAIWAGQKPQFSRKEIPEGAVFGKPTILLPGHQTTVHLAKQNGRMEVRWTGDPNLNYVVQYDAGKGWRNLTGAIPVKGTGKVFGPLPREAWEPLPYWNPYKIRVSPYGLDEYWSEWTEFRVAE